MNQTFQTHLEILPEPQQWLWPSLRPITQLGFVLYGGTAIALRLGHRSSVDFDFFTDQPLNKRAIRTACPCLAIADVLQDQPDTLTVKVPYANNANHSVKVSLFGAISFGRVGTPDLTQDHVLQVASMDDLMATKLKVLLQRVEAKDYQDIAALIRAGVSLEIGLAATRTMFGHSFQPSECLKALVYFKGGDLDSLAHKDKETLIRAAGDVRELPILKVISRDLSNRPTLGNFPSP